MTLAGLRWYDDPVALATDPGVDVVVELIGGSDGPARALVAGRAGRRQAVVTANKALLAVHGAALPRGRARGVPLAFEAAVAGGIPVIKALREGLAGNRITPRRRHPERHLQLHPHRDARARARVRRRAGRGAERSATPRPTRPSTSTASTPRTSWRSWPRSPSAGRWISTPCMSRASAASRALDIAFAERARLPHQAAGPRAADRGRDRGAGASLHGAGRPRPIARVDGVFNAVVAEGDFVGRVMLEGRGAGAGPTASRRGRRPDRPRARPRSRRSGAPPPARCPTRRRCRWPRMSAPTTCG